MDKKVALLFCVTTVFIISCVVFVVNQRIDFPTLFFAAKIVIPAGFVAYFLGFFIGKTIEKSKGVTDLINAEVQQQYVDDLLLMPEQVLNSSPFIPVRASEEESVSENEVPNVENGDDSQEEFKII